MITSKIRIRRWLFFVLLTIGLIMSLVGIAVWRGQQQVDRDYFQSVYYLSIATSLAFAVLLIVSVLYFRRSSKR